MAEKTLLVSKINNGTVIDHIPPGKSFKVLSILNIDSRISYTVTVAVHVMSRKGGFKDIVKIEDRFLQRDELDRISMVAPGATISIIKNYEIVEKFTVKIPEEIVGIVNCPNQNCISNSKEPVKARFIVRSQKPIVIQCFYCQKQLSDSEIVANL